MNWHSCHKNDLITEAPPKMYAESREKDKIFREISPILADMRPPKSNPTSFKLKSDREFMLSSHLIIADTYVTQQKKIIKSKLPIIPKFARTIGKEIIPDPIAVPASKDIAPNCFLSIIDTTKKY